MNECLVDNRDILAPITGKGRSQLPSERADFDPAPYRVLRRILLDYLEVDPGKCFGCSTCQRSCKFI